jgi:hypothetical protein
VPFDTALSRFHPIAIISSACARLGVLTAGQKCPVLSGPLREPRVYAPRISDFSCKTWKLGTTKET